jgi:hypothetical protein
MGYILGRKNQTKATGTNWVRNVECIAGEVDTTELLENIKNHDTYTFDECMSANMTVDKVEKKADYDFSITGIKGFAVVQTMPIDENGEIIRSIEKSPYFTGYVITKADTIKLNKSTTDKLLAMWELFKTLGTKRDEETIIRLNDIEGNEHEYSIAPNQTLAKITLDVKKTGKYKQYNTYNADFYMEDEEE